MLLKLLGSCALVLSASLALGSGEVRQAPIFEALLKPSSLVELSAAEQGILKKVFAERGQHIEAGELLAQLDNSVEEADFRLAQVKASMQAEVETARVELEHAAHFMQQQRTLLEKGLLMEEQFFEIEKRHELAKVALDRAIEQSSLRHMESERSKMLLDRKEIRSPISGVVVKRMFEAGEYVSSSGNSPIYQLAQLDPLHVEAFVPVEFFGEIESGQMAEVEFLDLSGQKRLVQAKVALTDGMIDAASETFGVRVELPNPQGRIPAGVHCTLRFLMIKAPK